MAGLIDTDRGSSRTLLCEAGIELETTVFDGANMDIRFIEKAPARPEKRQQLGGAKRVKRRVILSGHGASKVFHLYRFRTEQHVFKLMRRKVFSDGCSKAHNTTRPSHQDLERCF